jgi:hypothetical protein
MLLDMIIKKFQNDTNLDMLSNMYKIKRRHKVYG